MMTEIEISELTEDQMEVMGSDWREDLSEDLRGHPALAGFADVAALAQEHVHLQKLIGKKGILPPSDDATDEDLARYFDALGRPAAPSDYQLDDIERPQELPWSSEVEEQMLTHMHAAGLTNEQAQSLIAGYVDLQSTVWAQAQGEQARVFESALEDLRMEWGSTFDAQIDMANRAFAKAFGENVDEVRQLRLADGRYLGDHPHLVRAFAGIGQSMMEAAFAEADPTSPGRSQDDARTQLSELESDPASRSALLDRSHPDHKSTVARRSRLANLAYSSVENVADMRL